MTKAKSSKIFNLNKKSFQNVKVFILFFVHLKVYYQSKFKYIQGKSAHKSEHITNIRNLSTMWPSECNGFQINSKYAAFILTGNSGNIGIVELNKPGRLPDTVINCIINKTKLSDFTWDPFDDDVIAVACDDGIVRVWTIPEGGLISSLTEPDVELKGHIERYFMSYCIFELNYFKFFNFKKTLLYKIPPLREKCFGKCII